MINTDTHTGPSFSISNRLLRFVWSLVYFLFFKYSPRPFHSWRSFILKVFNSKVGKGVHVYPKVQIWAPWNLVLGDECGIGNGVNLYCQDRIIIGKKTVIGNFVWIFPYVVLTNDPHPPRDILKGVTVEDFAVIATMSVVLPGVKIGKGALIGAHSTLKSNAEPGMLYVGSPAETICNASKIRLQDGTRRPAYPWTTHFSRGYPEGVINEWKTKADSSSKRNALE